MTLSSSECSDVLCVGFLSSYIVSYNSMYPHPTTPIFQRSIKLNFAKTKAERAAAVVVVQRGETLVVFNWKVKYCSGLRFTTRSELRCN